jgi:indolepyruvate ferredoxin oxidoreductase alpha subunit
VQCPSYYRSDIDHNPTAQERFRARLRGTVISYLQRRRARRSPAFS